MAIRTYQYDEEAGGYVSPEDSSPPYAPSSYEELTSQYTEERGFLGDTMSSLAHSGLDLLDLSAKAMETITGYDNDLDDWTKAARKEHSMFKPDVSEFYGEDSKPLQWWKAGIRAIPTSIAAAAPGMMVGGKLGAFGGPIAAGVGAAIGGALSSSGLFGLGGYGQAKEEGAAQGLTGKELESYAKMEGAINASEGVMTGVTIGLFGPASIAGKSLTSSLKAMLAPGMKEMGKKWSINVAGEVAQEVLQGGASVENSRRFGLETAGHMETAIASAGAAVVAAGLIGAGGSVYSARQNSAIISGLQAKDQRAVDAVTSSLESQDSELAEAWKSYSTSIMDSTTTGFNLDEDLIAGYAKRGKMEAKIAIDNPLTASSEDLDVAVSRELSAVNEDIAAEKPIVVGENTIADRVAEKIYDATDEEVLKLQGTTFDRYVKQGLMDQEHADALDVLLLSKVDTAVANQQLEAEVADLKAKKDQGRTLGVSKLKGKPVVGKGTKDVVSEALGIQPEVVEEASDPLALPTSGKGAITKGKSEGLSVLLGKQEEVEEAVAPEKPSDPYSQLADIGKKGAPVVASGTKSHDAMLSSIKKEKEELKVEEKATTNMAKKQATKIKISELQLEQDKVEAAKIAKEDFDAKVQEAKDRGVEEVKKREGDTPQEALESAVDKAASGDMKGANNDLVTFFKTQEGTKDISEETLVETADAMIRENLPASKEEIVGEIEKGASTVAAVGGKGKGAKVIDWKDGGVLKEDGNTAIGEGADGTSFYVDRMFKDKEKGEITFAVTTTKPSGEKIEEVIVATSAAKLKKQLESTIAETKGVKEVKKVVKETKEAKTQSVKDIVQEARDKGDITGYEKKGDKTGTINGEEVTFTNIVSGTGQGWYVKDRPVNLGKSKIAAVESVYTKGLPEAVDTKKAKGGEVKTLSKTKVAKEQAKLDKKQKEKKPTTLKRKKGSKGRAEVVDQAPLTPGGRQEKFSEMTGLELVELAARKGDKQTVALARALLANKKIRYKLATKPVKVGLVERSKVVDGKRISMSNVEDATVNLHEAIHSITVQEMRSNEAFKGQVTELMNMARKEAVSQGLFTQEQMDQLSKDNRADFSEGGDFYKEQDTYSLAYALRNEREFLAQVFGRESVRDFLKGIKLENPKGRIKTAWDKIVNMVRKALNLSSTQYTALHKALDLTFSLAAETDIRKSSVKAKTKKISKRVGGTLTRQKIVEEVDEAPAPVGVPVISDGEVLRLLKKYKEPMVKVGPREFFESSGKLLKQLAMPLTDRLRYIDPRMIKYLRKDIDFQVSQANMKGAGLMHDFSVFYKELSESDRSLLDWALKNTDEEAMSIRNKILGEEFKNVEKLLKEIHDRMDAVGSNSFSEVENYYPRRVKDIEGLIKFLRARKKIMEQEKESGVKLTEKEKDIIREETQSLTLIEESFLAEEEKQGKPVSQLQKVEIVNSVMNTGRYSVIAFNLPHSAKERAIRKVSPEMNRYYEDSLEALVNHVYTANESIETRKAFSYTNRLNKVKEGLALQATIRKKVKAGENIDEEMKKIEEVSEHLQKLDDNVDEGISEFLSEKGLDLTSEQHKEVIEIFRARLNQKGTYGAVSTARNAMLMSTLGSPISAITQLGDLAWSVYDNTLMNTVKAGFTVLSGKQRYTRKDFDLERSMKEFSEGSSKWVDRVLKWSGLQFMDMFGKEVYMEAALNRAESVTKVQFIRHNEHIFEEKTGEVYDKIKARDLKDEDVRYYVFNALANVQPIALSEMPEIYLTSGNGRIFYTLKTYQIKAMNNILRESKKPGFKGKAKVVELVLILTMAGASADELKDLFLGRTTSFSDNLHSNLLKLAYVSKWNLESNKTIKSTLTDLLVPPVNLVDDPLRDLRNLVKGEPTFETMKDMPWGKLIHAWTRQGKDKTLFYEKRDITDDFKKVLEKKGSLVDIRKRINAFKRKVKGSEEITPINYLATRKSLIRSIRKEKQEKN